jgi:hypothetical protein
MTEIDKYIKTVIDELNSSLTSKQRRRHLEAELESLSRYKDNNPNNTDVPSSLELYCSDNPSAPECRIYDD